MGVIVDVHAHFLTDRSGRTDWESVNASRLRAGEMIGITTHVASVLGTWGATSPTYFPSRTDLDHANAWLLDFAARSGGRVQAYVAVNPNYPGHAVDQIRRGRDAGAVGVKLAASRRADDALVDGVVEVAAELALPVLHHIWQRRRRDWPGQDASDAVELARVATRHPTVPFLLAHLGGGGDWSHSLRAVADVPNVFVDLSGSGVDTGMLEQTVAAVGTGRMVWGSDLTMDTGLAKLRYLESMALGAADRARILGDNAVRIFPEGAFT